jgi:hypothetical protein
VVLVGHEGAHYIRLRLIGAHPQFCVKLRRGAFGWRYDPSGLDPRARRAQLLDGVLVGAIIWVAAAWLLPGLRADLLIVAACDLAANLLIPGSDGWQMRHLVPSEVKAG